MWFLRFGSAIVILMKVILFSAMSVAGNFTYFRPSRPIANGVGYLVASFGPKTRVSQDLQTESLSPDHSIVLSRCAFQNGFNPTGEEAVFSPELSTKCTAVFRGSVDQLCAFEYYQSQVSAGASVFTTGVGMVLPPVGLAPALVQQAISAGAIGSSLSGAYKRYHSSLVAEICPGIFRLLQFTEEPLNGEPFVASDELMKSIRELSEISVFNSSGDIMGHRVENCPGVERAVIEVATPNGKIKQPWHADGHQYFQVEDYYQGRPSYVSEAARACLQSLSRASRPANSAAINEPRPSPRPSRSTQ